MKLISIIVPAYNVEQYLARCLDSILGQTYTNLEILVVDDGSADRTGTIADEYAQKDDRIKVIHQKNRGLSGARNAALEIAKGDYIGYVDGDDFIESTMYAKMLDACESTGSEMAGCAYQKVDEAGNPVAPASVEAPAPVKVAPVSVEAPATVKVVPVSVEAPAPTEPSTNILMSVSEALETYVMDNKAFHMYNSVWSKLFKRELVMNERFPEGRNSEDIVYTGRALAKCNRCVFVNEPLYDYVVNRSGSIMNDREKMAKRRFEDELPFWKEQIEIFREKGHAEIAEKALYQLCRRELFYYMEFRELGMTKAAKKLATLIKDDKEIIESVYQKSFVSKGDRSRIRLFLFAPNLYFLVTTLYNKAIVPLRQ